MNPQLLPAKNVPLYGAITLLTFCSMFVLVAIKPRSDLNGFAAMAAALSLFGPIIFVFWEHRLALRRSTLMLSEHVETIQRSFPHDFVKDIEFRISQSADARAIQLGKRKCCLIPAADIELLEAKEGGESDPDPMLIARISHELSHLLSNDAGIFSLVTIIWLMGLGISTAIWIQFLSIGAAFRITGLGGLALTVALFGTAGYRMVRLREFYADRLAAYLKSESLMDAFLAKNARREPYLIYPIGYKVTHPSFCERLTVFRDFRSVYRLNFFDIVLFSLVYAVMYVMIPISYAAASTRIGVVTGTTIGATGYIFGMFYIFGNLVSGSLVRSIEFKELAIFLGINAIISPIFVFMLVSSFGGFTSGANVFRTSETLLAYLVVIPTYACSVWWLSGDLGKFRGPKKLSRRFFLILWLASFLVFGAAIMAMTFGYQLLINAFDLSIETLLILILALFVALALVLLLRLSWTWYVGRLTRKWAGGILPKTEFAFYSQEWSPGIAISAAQPMGCAARILMIAVFYVYGLLLYIELNPSRFREQLIRDPETDSMGAAEDILSLIFVWTIIFSVSASVQMLANRGKPPTMKLSPQWNAST